MYLKGMEVQGFKSFANKMKFEFQNGITCIVGPNGSGKSNVADAVRWVLGEQRVKQLRGGNMQDVIFAGTEARKPQGFAAVSLILDNTDHALNIDFEEVTVTRRLYRSGESEYLINGNNCRLKDINELFYDTGIGKEGYSIIGQGQIDRILSSKPEDRRELFDEAVGIVKYKHRKVEAEKRLLSEQENMQRLSDIMRELEYQVGPLAKQCETAKTYLRLYDELKKQDMLLFSLEGENIRQKISDAEGKLAIVNDQIRDTEAEEEKLKEEFEEGNRKLTALENEMNAAKDDAAKAEIAIKDLEGKIQLLNEQIRYEEIDSRKQDERKEQLKKEISDKEDEQQELFAKIINLSKEVTQKKKELETAREKFRQIDEEISHYDDIISTGKEKIIGLLQEKNESSVSLQKLETTKEQLQLRKAEFVRDILENKTTINQINEVVAQHRKDYEERESRRFSFETKENELRRKENEITEQLHQLANDMEKVQSAYHAYSTKADSLKNIAERYEGYGQSVKRIMDVEKQYPGIHGVVADIIKVDAKYEVAIETALGTSVQHVVTETEIVAKQLVEYLKKNKFGRATFLPLDGINGYRNTVNADVLKENGIIGTADTLVSFGKKYANIVSYLLGRTVVADNIDHALATARKYKYSLRIVTLEGEQLNPGGSISGGAYKNTSNLLGRKREIEELEMKSQQELEKYDRHLETQKKLRDDREQVRAQAREAADNKQKLAIELNTINVQIKELDAKKAGFMGTQQRMEEDIRSMEEQILDIDTESKNIRNRLSELEKDNKESEKEVAQKAESIDAMKETRDRASARVNDLTIAVTEVTGKEAFLQESRERISSEIEALEEEQDSLENGKKDLSRIIRGKNNEIEEIEQEIEESKQQIEEANGRFLQKQSERDAFREANSSSLEKMQEIGEEKTRLNSEKLRLETNHDSLEEKITESVDYLWEQYEILPSEANDTAQKLVEKAKEDGEEIPGLTAMKKAISDIKLQIKKLGNVNVSAIDQYRDVQDRYEFMKNQYDDLVESEKAIQGVIDELNEGMRRQFNEQFGRIQVEFDKVFKELFGGGKGTLELVDESDVIETGVYINAQPPGKKLQNMMQLSGGEKALTAIALLFAIQNLKPSPFCLLDEIEAALDDSNVSRYAKYLDKLKEHTQFILITHRRGTMVAADRLYGITMQEKGVSTLVSVSMIEKDLDS